MAKKTKKKKSDLLYIMNPNCGWCKKADPVVEELVKEGYKITSLNVTDQFEGKRAAEVKSKYELQCGTPLFLDAETGNSVCGFRPKDVLEKWANGEEIPKPEPTQAPPARPMPKKIRFEYVWIDGKNNLRSKVRNDIIPITEPGRENPKSVNQQIFENTPEWGFDGSSTYQATTDNSDLLLKPVRIYPNVTDASHIDNNQVLSWIVLCEVYNTDGTPHETNSRYKLREFVDSNPKSNDMFVSFEQEFVFWNDKHNVPAGWEGNVMNPEERGEPNSSGEYYCGIGGNNGTFRSLLDGHIKACTSAGIFINGYNAEVEKSQWEYQTRPTPSLKAADDLWASRYILGRVAETRNLDISYDPKPYDENRNGSGCHINFSTENMRNDFSQDHVDSVIEALALNHETAISVYGEGNERRLTGKNETSDINNFSYGNSDRSASIRIPAVGNYLEDRRPAANVNPYDALLNLTEVINTIEETVLTEA